ncbi:PP0621 family protein [Achromobacter marplatensis]|uniref:PP0621 family protein n=1 Tax=Achromobacter marplatensis TaxID=470868 RepID=UPI0039F6E5AC
MGKLLFWVVLIIAVLFVARIAARMAAAKQAGAQADTRRGGHKRAAPEPAAPESMVRCAHCGIHLPRSEAMLQNGLTWCSAEHARLGPAKK